MLYFKVNQTVINLNKLKLKEQEKNVLTNRISSPVIKKKILPVYLLHKNLKINVK